MPPDYGMLKGRKTLLDYQDLQREFDLKKQLAAQKLQESATGADLPAALQLANEYQKRIAMGDVEGANLIAQFAKTTDKGIEVGADGSYMPMAGYGPAVGSIAANKAGMEQQAKADVDFIMNPRIDFATQTAKNKSDIAAAGPLARERTAGAAAGEFEGQQGKNSQNATQTLNLVSQAEKLLPSSTSGVLDQTGNWINAKRGVSTERTQADKQLQVISAALTGNVPRFEGPQGVLDVELYKQAAGDVANTSIPYGDRLAALQMIKEIQARYAKNTQTGGSTVTPADAAAELARRRAARGQ